MMKKSFSFLLALGVCALQIGAAAQTTDLNPAPPSEIAEPSNGPSSKGPSEIDDQPLSADQLRASLTQARQMLKSGADVSNGQTVTLAVFDPATSKIHLLNIDKDAFLTKDADLTVTSHEGRSLRVRVVRANGVNTAVTVKDSSNGAGLVPLMVAYPIVRGGSVTEIAYYTSAHPALLSDDVISSGQAYVTAMLDDAAKSLAGKGVNIPSDIVDVAEHLCVVEHTDHKRFMTEEHSELIPEILSLYALNQGNTFRYSVSTAGAGGMIQMIPRTYEGIRQQHTNVPLQADFVSGMRDHANALEAMLLYMNDTWKKLQESSEVQDALRNGAATKPELLAAGYNSNPLRLPAYLKDGGTNWRALIPAETQMYLAIYKAVDENVAFDGLDETDAAADSSRAIDVASVASAPRRVPLISWLADELLAPSSVLLRFLP
jgi:hypothetical protein